MSVSTSVFAPRNRPLRRLRIAAIATVAFLGVSACSTSAAPGSASHAPSSAPAVISRAELDCLVAPWRNGASRLEVYQMAEGWDALRQARVLPGALAADPPGFRGAALSFLDSDDDHVGEHEDRYTLFVASFETVEDAQNGFEAAVAHHESADGWGFSTDQLDPDYNSDPGLGDEGVYYIDGADYGYPEISVYLWRTRNLLLQAVDYHPYDQRDLITKIAHRMAAQAEQRYVCAGLGS